MMKNKFEKGLKVENLGEKKLLVPALFYVFEKGLVIRPATHQACKDIKKELFRDKKELSPEFSQELNAFIVSRWQ